MIGHRKALKTYKFYILVPPFVIVIDWVNDEALCQEISIRNDVVAYAFACHLVSPNPCKEGY